MSKLILTNEVSGLGSAGDVVDVKAGYARNYLIPRGFAVAWSTGGEKQVAQIRSARDARADDVHGDAPRRHRLRRDLRGRLLEEQDLRLHARRRFHHDR